MEESCIDYLITSQDLEELLVEAFIDDKQVYTLTKFTSTKGTADVKKTDHFSLVATFSLKHEVKKRKKEETFKLRDEDGLNKFHVMTSVCPRLKNIFRTNLKIDDLCDKWYREVEKILHQCFQKIKITEVPPKKTLEYAVLKALQDLKAMKELRIEASEMCKPMLLLEIAKQEEKVASLQGQKISRMLSNNKHLLQEDGIFNFSNAWKLKKKMYPKCSDAPFAVKGRDGELVTEYESILEVMKDEFTHRLRNREINPEYTELKELKEHLCKLRLQITKTRSYGKWSMEDLKLAISKLKGNKCKDPHGHINELYMNMGEDGLVSLLEMLNKVKEELLIPQKLNLSNVSTIYKGKGSKQDVINLRGIFKLPIVRNILDRLIYFDEGEELGEKMSQFQVGNQKKRNIRDHTLVVHAVVNETHRNKENIDIQFTDIKQCFDSIWLDEATNDLYDNGVTGRNLNLLYEGNAVTRMCVETQFGRSPRVELKRIVMQGSVTGGMICSNQISKLCPQTFKEGIVYMYKDKIPIPALAMVDDIVMIARCNSADALAANIKTDSFIQRKKLEGQTGEGKCQWIHYGKGNCNSCYSINGKRITRADVYK